MIGEKVRDNGCLTPDYCHSGLFCAFYQPKGDFLDNTAIVFGHGEVVEKANWFRACADQIIRAHRDTIYPDCVILPHQLSNDDLSPDTIRVKAEDPAIVEVNKACVVANRKNGIPDFPFAGLECRFEPSSENLVGFPDLRNLDSRSGIGHAGPRQAYSFSPVRRAYAITYRLLVSSTRSLGRSGGLGVGCPAFRASSRVFL